MEEKEFYIKVKLVEVIEHNFDQKILQIKTERGTVIGAFPGDLYELDENDELVVATNDVLKPIEIEPPVSITESTTSDPGAKEVVESKDGGKTTAKEDEKPKEEDKDKK